MRCGVSMEVMGSIQLGECQVKWEIQKRLEKRETGSSSSIVRCGGLRGRPRPPLWRGKRVSTEAIQATQSLKLAKSSPSTLHHLFNSKLTRLLKDDLLDTLSLLQTQNELHLALKVFELVQKEVWYKPDLSLYHRMIQLLGKNNLVEMAEEFFSKIEKEGLKPDTRAFTEMIGAYLKVGMYQKSMEMYGRMKATGCSPDELTFTILIRNLDNTGNEELLATVKKDCHEYMEYPEKFLEVLEQKNARRPLRNVVSLSSPGDAKISLAE